MIPIKLTNDTWPPKDGEFCSSIVLYYDNWNDYSYRTSFVMCYCDADGMVREVGNVKIYYWQNDEVRTNQYSRWPSQFTAFSCTFLSSDTFSGC